jgi:anaerobic dimethyl sulfoxide reductase subunit B (iron-sulfur subunit)
MAKKGILADMNYCTGCHACEIACKQEHGYPVGVGGIKINEMITEEADIPHVHFDYVPYFSKQCDLCATRIASEEDNKPACVKHCGTFSLHYGDIEELSQKLESMPRGILYSPR